MSRRSVPSRSLPSRSRAPKWRRRRAHRPAHAPRARLRGARRGRGGAAEGGGPGGGGRLRASVSSRAAGGQTSPRRNNWGPPCLCVCGGGGICVICVCERRQDGREGAPPASPARCRRSVPQVAPNACLVPSGEGVRGDSGAPLPSPCPPGAFLLRCCPGFAPRHASGCPGASLPSRLCGVQAAGSCWQGSPSLRMCCLINAYLLRAKVDHRDNLL